MSTQYKIKGEPINLNNVDFKGAGKAVVSYYKPSSKWLNATNILDPNTAADSNNPEDNAIYLPDLMKVLERRDKGLLSDSEYLDKLQYGVFNSKEGWDEKAKLFVDKRTKDLRNVAIASGAGGIVPADYSGVEISLMSGIVWGVVERARQAQTALRTVNVDMTRYDYPEQTSRMTINRNINYGDDIEIRSVGVKNNTVNLKCDAAHFLMSNEVRYRPYSVDVWRLNLESMGYAFIRDMADQVVEILTDASITAIAAGGLWSDNTKNPYLDIAGALNVIEQNHGSGDSIILHALAKAALDGNSNTKTASMTSKPQQAFGSQRLDSGEIYRGIVNNIIDTGMTQTKATVWDSFFTPALIGPQGLGFYEDVPRFKNGLVAFKWWQKFLGDLTKIRVLTGVYT